MVKFIQRPYITQQMVKIMNNEKNLNENLAFSINEFCKLHSISRAKFYLMINAGEAPQIMQVGRRRLISREAAQKWRQQMEQQTEKNGANYA